MAPGRAIFESSLIFPDKEPVWAYKKTEAQNKADVKIFFTFNILHKNPTKIRPLFRKCVEEKIKVFLRIVNIEALKLRLLY